MKEQKKKNLGAQFTKHLSHFYPPPHKNKSISSGGGMFVELIAVLD